MTTTVGTIITYEGNHHQPGKPSVYVCPTINEAKKLLQGIIDDLSAGGSCAITVKFGAMILEEVKENDVKN